MKEISHSRACSTSKPSNSAGWSPTQLICTHQPRTQSAGPSPIAYPSAPTTQSPLIRSAQPEECVMRELLSWTFRLSVPQSPPPSTSSVHNVSHSHYRTPQPRWCGSLAVGAADHASFAVNPSISIYEVDHFEKQNIVMQMTGTSCTAVQIQRFIASLCATSDQSVLRNNQRYFQAS